MDKHEKFLDKLYQTRNFDFSNRIFGVITRALKNSVHGWIVANLWMWSLTSTMWLVLTEMRFNPNYIDLAFIKNRFTYWNYAFQK